jgi:phenylalanyl-tRNA synthetase beta subunit
MASLLLIFLLALLISPSMAVTTCTSQKFKNNKLYANCTDLPTLSSYLHWNYNASNSFLAVAFVAAASKTGGWIAWAINPTGTGMAGAQALVAYTLYEGIPTVQTYNIASYTSAVPGTLSFDVWDISAEFSYGTLKIFATVKVPEKVEMVNHVWQVGPGINKATGVLEKHDFASANLVAHGTLSLVATRTTNTTRGDAMFKSTML